MENLNLHLDDNKECVCENVVVVKKLVNWKDKASGDVKSYYAWFVRVHTKDGKDVDVKITELTGKLKTIDELGTITYKK